MPLPSASGQTKTGGCLGQTDVGVAENDKDSGGSSHT